VLRDRVEVRPQRRRRRRRRSEGLDASSEIENSGESLDLTWDGYEAKGVL
jgi:hypothetical protein